MLADATPSIRTLDERFFSLGASWAFSLQPVLPHDYRPALPSHRQKLGQAINAVTGTRRLEPCCFLPQNVLGLTPRPSVLLACGCATVRTLRRSPKPGL